MSPDPQHASLTRRTQRYLDEICDRGDVIVSSTLLRTEILCQANRQAEIDVDEADRFIAMVNLVQLEASDLEDAPMMPGRLRTLDAIHLSVAVRTGADLMIGYDQELRRAARLVGLRVGPDAA